MKRKTLIIFFSSLFILLTTSTNLFADNDFKSMKLYSLSDEVYNLRGDLLDVYKSISDESELMNILLVCDEAHLTTVRLVYLAYMIKLHDFITDKQNKKKSTDFLSKTIEFTSQKLDGSVSDINKRLSFVENGQVIFLGNQIKSKIREASEYLKLIKLD